MTWDQLQTLEALVRTGSIEAAAKELGLRHSSISRRVAAMEAELDTLLFNRGARLVPTAVCLRLCVRATQMKAHADEARDELESFQRTLAERLVITTNDVLASLLVRAVATANLPGRVELSVSDHERDLAPGVVDLALRPTYEPGGALRGYRMGQLRMGVYRARGGGGDGWVLPARSLREKASMRWWKAVPADAPGVLECDSLVAMRDACLAGLGQAVLPAFLAANDSRLKLTRELDGGPPVWLLSPVTRERDGVLRQTRERLAAALRAVSDAWR